MFRLGIDFGTTRTVVAACSDGRYPVIGFDIGGRIRDHIPGMAAVAGGELRYGWDAAALLVRPPSGAPGAHEMEGAEVIRSIKRVAAELAPDERVPGLSAPVTALELTAGFLAYVRRLVLERAQPALIGGRAAAGEASLADPGSARLAVEVAVPAHASTPQRYLTLEAFTRAGFDVIGMRNEPTAAAIEFAHRHRAVLSRRSPKRYIVVYDLGGGTFDTSAVSLEGRRFTVLATAGVARLGGDDFDEVIAGLVLDAVGRREAELDRAGRVLLCELCREAKETLTPRSRKLAIDVSALWPEVAPAELPVQALYERCEPLIERSLACVGEVFEGLPAHGLDPDDARELGGLYLVGGAAAFPPVARRLRARYGRKIELAPEPCAATATGLAICADPDAAPLVREAVTRHVGVWREAEGGREKVFDPILAKNQAVDGAGAELIVQRTYRPAHTVGKLRFIECDALSEQGQPAGDVKPLTQISFPYDPSLAEAGDLSKVPVERCPTPLDEEIAETYVYGRDGTLAVEIENRTYGYRRSYVLDTLR